MPSLRWFSLCCAGVLLAACDQATAPEPGAETRDGAPTESVTPLALSNSWSTKTRMWDGRSEAVGATINNIIYVVGGYGSSGQTTTLQVYNVGTNTWTTRKALPVARWGGSNGASVINGRLYVSGGNYWPSALFVYNPATNSWTRKADMPGGTSEGAQGVIGGRLYVYSGHTYEARRFFRYNPATNTWAILPKPRFAHGRPAAGVISGKFYLAGGSEDYNTIGYLEVYDPATNKWTIKADMPVQLEQTASGVINGKLYVAGGSGNLDLYWTNVLLVYDPVTNRWTQKASMPTARWGAAGAVAGGKFFVMGGSNGLQVLRKVEAYTP